MSRLADDREGVRKQEIVRAALHIFRQKGYHATSMQDIADAVGLHKGSLYHHIASKEELLGTIFQQAFTSFLERAEAIAASGAPPPEKLRQLLHAHVDAVAGRLDEVTVYLDEWRMLGEAQFQVLAQQRNRYQELLGDVLEAGVECGAFRPVDVQAVVFALLGMANWIYQWYRPAGRLRPDELAERFADLILCGLQPRPNSQAFP